DVAVAARLALRAGLAAGLGVGSPAHRCSGANGRHSEKRQRAQQCLHRIPPRVDENARMPTYGEYASATDAAQGRYIAVTKDKVGTSIRSTCCSSIGDTACPIGMRLKFCSSRLNAAATSHKATDRVRRLIWILVGAVVLLILWLMFTTPTPPLYSAST